MIRSTNTKEMQRMKIKNVIKNTIAKDNKNILQTIILSAIIELEKEGRMTPEAKKNLIENLDVFLSSESSTEKIECLHKLSAELLIHEDEANQQEIYIELRSITGLSPI